MSKLKIGLFIDDADMGALHRLVTEGTIKIFKYETAEEIVKEDPRDFARKVRSGTSNGSGGSRPAVSATDALVTIMQRNPDKHHHREDLGVQLAEEFGHAQQTVSGTLFDLANQKYVQHVSPSHYALTDKGKQWNQNDHIKSGRR
jgi:hypothetical protein